MVLLRSLLSYRPRTSHFSFFVSRLYPQRQNAPLWLSHLPATPPPATVFPDLNRTFCSNSKSTKKINTKVNFRLSDSDSDTDQGQTADSPSPSKHRETDDKISKLRPPHYDPFNKKPELEMDPEDPLIDRHFNNALNMFDTLCKDGLTHEALELCSHIKEKDQMPDVVGYTSVIEEYAKAGGQSKEALKVFMRMLGAGVAPNVYNYSVLIKGLAADAKIGNAKKYLLEMMGKGMMRNAGAYCAVLEAMVREQRVEEGRELVEQMKTKGLVVDEKAVRSVLSSEAVINLLFGK